MGIGPNKSKILKILENSVTGPNINEQRNLKLEYKYKSDYLDEEMLLSNNEENENSFDSFDFSFEGMQSITSCLCNIKNPKKFPYVTVGILSVKFPLDDKKYEYTCFAIFTNIIVTL